MSLQQNVKLLSAGTFYPQHVYTQSLLSKLLTRYCSQQLQLQSNSSNHVHTTNIEKLQTIVSRINTVFHSTAIHKRNFIFNSFELLHQNNTLTVEQTIQHTSKLLLQECKSAITQFCNKLNITPQDIDCIISTSGIYTVPTIDFGLLNMFKHDVHRLHLPGLASGGGVRTIIEAFDYLKLNPTHCVMTLCVESGSHGWLGALRHSIDTVIQQDTGNFQKLLNDIIVSAIMGDGVGICLLTGSQHKFNTQIHTSYQPINILSTMSVVLPNTQHVIQRITTPYGYHTRLDPNLPTTVVPPLSDHLVKFIQHNNLTTQDINYFVIHPGGSKVLKGVEQYFNLQPQPYKTAPLRHSWHSMRDYGNCSSVSIIDVLRRSINDKSMNGNGIAFAVGPGIVGEALLLQR